MARTRVGLRTAQRIDRPAARARTWSCCSRTRRRRGGSRRRLEPSRERRSSRPRGGVDLGLSEPAARPPVTVMSEADVQRLVRRRAVRPPIAPQQFIAVLPFRVGRTDRREPRADAADPAGRQGSARSPTSPSSGTPTRPGRRPATSSSGCRRANADSQPSDRRRHRRVVIEVTSHGEADLLVKTADEVADPRNRRVEITIR